MKSELGKKLTPSCLNLWIIYHLLIIARSVFGPSSSCSDTVVALKNIPEGPDLFMLCVLRITPLLTKINASKCQISSQIPLKNMVFGRKKHGVCTTFFSWCLAETQLKSAERWDLEFGIPFWAKFQFPPLRRMIFTLNVESYKANYDLRCINTKWCDNRYISVQ